MEDSSNDDTNSSFDIDLSNVGSSTPTNSSFLSPIKQFDNLNINNLSDIHEEDLEVGNDTIDNSNSSDDEEDNAAHTPHVTSRPVFVGKRKRANVSDVDMVTPTSFHSRSTHSQPSQKSDSMSVCSHTDTSLSNFKLSFSNSDSTPCPVPAKKKLKFLTDATPISNKKHLLNLSHSVKTTVSEVSYEFHDYQQYQHDSDVETSSPMPFAALESQSTPISQSTPSNSRAPSPESSPSAAYGADVSAGAASPVGSDDSSNRSAGSSPSSPHHPVLPSVNGYRLIPTDHQYEIVADITNDSEVHIADQRIEFDQEDSSNPRATDPYLCAPPEDPKENRLEIRRKYMASFQVPLLNVPSSKAEILEAISAESVLGFYEFIRLKDETLTELVRKERLRWHPDRWVSTHEDRDVIHAVSSCLNAVWEQL
ncbi:hypothetical protein PSN45_001523 [Yamadazyma tenuis]|uniref:Uncharacterized protein n=1 Tax=Candida tenuis (strain ATCC 10573 / BCRC 21748 / CBS 615 / JCM 9827 / NBRC 10315 / NRRL Y-1498 / VKM Y-70) TaxID=590646 RepID=G3B2X9_CANTC|nr:uncharacterized protein CANTEDRAFT_134293 [Yamadazyma tenuis ATCC 10573]EGV64453.1 hypothetical protein CANTEDRAFT_134293 [Yamadazyma tenuis ATCC 10573]WEJ94045.1 hypothetical protein PSN45_001523 [Yamadazyma tenuis]